jgi:alkyl hydroperoxide reductase subunit AhpC
MPTVSKLHEDSKDKGLEIISISFDGNERSWQNAIQRHNMVWTQIISKKGESDDIGELYGVLGIPHTLLIDSKGEVVAINLRGQELIDKIKKILEE